jgi:parallel beta helix pectate lyase-like protein
MNKLRLITNGIAAAIFILAFVTIAQAQATRTWVSGVGDDVNPCSRTAPCKTFAGAISKTAACGEINAIDAAGFGGVTITKAITIDGTGVLAGIVVSGTNAIIVNAGVNDVVTLRALDINGLCTGIHGIRILAAKAVNIQDCEVYKFSTGHGISVDATNNVMLNVRNSVIRDNTLDGINTFTTTGTVKVTLDRVSLYGNGNGIHARQTSRVVATNCNFSNNAGDGVFSDATASAATIRVWNSLISLNGGNGVHAGNAGGGGSGVELGQNQIDNNTGLGILIGTGGVVETFGNNSLRGNIAAGGNACAACLAVGPGI